MLAQLKDAHVKFWYFLKKFKRFFEIQIQIQRQSLKILQFFHTQFRQDTRQSHMTDEYQ